MVTGSKSFTLSSAVLFSEAFSAHGESVAPMMCTVITYSSRELVVLVSHHRKLNESWSSSLTLTWWNMLSISATRAVFSWRNLKRTSTRLLVQSGPCKRLLLSEVPSCFAAASKTTRTCSGLLSLITAECGTYQVLGPFFCSLCR